MNVKIQHNPQFPPSSAQGCREKAWELRTVGATASPSGTGILALLQGVGSVHGVGPCPVQWGSLPTRAVTPQLGPEVWGSHTPAPLAAAPVPARPSDPYCSKDPISPWLYLARDRASLAPVIIPSLNIHPQHTSYMFLQGDVTVSSSLLLYLAAQSWEAEATFTLAELPRLVFSSLS